MIKKSFAGIAACALVLLAGCAGPASPLATADTSIAPAALPTGVVLREPGLFPESVGWDAQHDRFLVTSVTRGIVTAVNDDGSHEPLTDGRELVSAVGVAVDQPRDRLLVAGGDFAVAAGSAGPGQAKLAIYDLDTGVRSKLVDLGALVPGVRHSANDVAVDAAGNAYITDTLAPVIYKVTPDGAASVFLTDARFAATDGLGLNGIEFDPDGFLFMTMVSSRALFHVALDAPATLTQVTLSEPLAGDGLALRADGHLFAAAPYASTVVELTTDDGWRSATATTRMTTAEGSTTTGMTLRDGVPYALNSHFEEMTKQPPSSDFQIFRVRTT